MALELLTTPMAGYATAASSTRPREIEYSTEQQRRRAADELAVLPRDGMLRGTMMPDYGRLGQKDWRGLVPANSVWGS